MPVILIAAVLQGWALYGLHRAIESNAWPATDQRWLIAFYALAVFVPATVQLLADLFTIEERLGAIAGETVAFVGDTASNMGRSYCEAAKLFEQGRFTMPVARTFRLDELAEAHRISEFGHVRGKLVLLP